MKTKSVIAIVLIVLAVAAGLRFVGRPLRTALAVGDDSNYSVGNATITGGLNPLSTSSDTAGIESRIDLELELIGNNTITGTNGVSLSCICWNAYIPRTDC